MVHLEHNRVKNPTGGNQLARYKREEGFELDKTEKQYMQQWLEWDLNWGCWISSLSQKLLGNAVSWTADTTWKNFINEHKVYLTKIN